MQEYTKEKIDFIERTKRDFKYNMPNAHYHDSHELYFLKSGKTKYFIDNEIYILSPGDFIFVPKGHYHKTDCYNIKNSERILINIGDDFFKSDFDNLLDFLIREKHIRIPKEHLLEINILLEKMEKENKLKQDDYFEMERLYLKELFILMKRNRVNNISKSFSEIYSTINDAAKYISENIKEDLSLLTLSDKYFLSPWYFSKIFKEATGIGLSEYITASRITLAKQLLSTTDYSITKVSAECGFNDSNYFTQVFKRITGFTPKKYSMQFSK